MTRPIILICMLLSVVIAASDTAGQEKEITGSEFWDYMRRSMEATKEKSYRAKVIIQHSDTPDGAWTLYSSWACDYVFPDRSHLLYTHGSHRELVSIGRTNFTREPGRPWVRSEREIRNSVSTAAGFFGFGPSARFLLIESESFNGAQATLIRVITRADHVKDKTKDTRTSNYWLDENWALIGNELIAFNESCACGLPQWQRRFETYEYSTDIRVEAPMNYSPKG